MTHPIEWCDETLNFFHGCTMGCSYCYARRMAKRLAAMQPESGYGLLVKHRMPAFAPYFDLFKMMTAKERLARSRYPKRVFLGSMGDPFHPGRWNTANSVQKLPESRIYMDYLVQGRILDFIEELSRHTFLMLTKRAHYICCDGRKFPHNLHLGTSITGRDDLQRVTDLVVRSSGEHLRWVSIEPLLDPDLRLAPHGLDWVVIGAQTGPGAPPPLVDTAKRLVEDAAALRVPVFVKRNMREADPDFPWPTELP